VVSEFGRRAKLFRGLAVTTFFLSFSPYPSPCLTTKGSLTFHGCVPLPCPNDFTCPRKYSPDRGGYKVFNANIKTITSSVFRFCFFYPHHVFYITFPKGYFSELFFRLRVIHSVTLRPFMVFRPKSPFFQSLEQTPTLRSD